VDDADAENSQECAYPEDRECDLEVRSEKVDHPMWGRGAMRMRIRKERVFSLLALILAAQ